MNIQTKQQHVESTMRLAAVIPVVIIEDARHAVPMARALVAGGIRAIEVTLRTPCALDAIRAIAQEVEGAVVGVGTRRPNKPVRALRYRPASRPSCWPRPRIAPCPCCPAWPPRARRWPCLSAATAT
jgi:hypothetical protein